MNHNDTTAVSTSAEIIATLRELIDALDRRVPHVERAGESRIAADAAALRSEAVNRIEALSRAGSGDVNEPAPPDAISDNRSRRT